MENNEKFNEAIDDLSNHYESAKDAVNSILSIVGSNVVHQQNALTHLQKIRDIAATALRKIYLNEHGGMIDAFYPIHIQNEDGTKTFIQTFPEFKIIVHDVPFEPEHFRVILNKAFEFYKDESSFPKVELPDDVKKAEDCEFFMINDVPYMRKDQVLDFCKEHVDKAIAKLTIEKEILTVSLSIQLQPDRFDELSKKKKDLEQQLLDLK